jgi:predicted nucleic acid-binding protein
MAIIADSGGIYCLYDRDDSLHGAAKASIEQERQRIYIPEACLGEIEYLLRSRLGNRALIAFVSDLRQGAFRIEPASSEDLAFCQTVLEKYSDMDLGLCDAMVLAVARRRETNTILTVDERDFRIMRTSKGKPFCLLPADAKRT